MPKVWIGEHQGFSRSAGGTMLVHCFIAMFFGFVGGFVWLVALADNVFHILPLPRLEVDVIKYPWQKELMRNAHTGSIANAMYVMAMVVMSPWLKFSQRQAKWVYYWAIIMLWGNLIGYSTAVFTETRGIQPLFAGDPLNFISYFTFYAAVIGAVITTGICLVCALREARSGE